MIVFDTTDELTKEQLEGLIRLNPEAWLEYALQDSLFSEVESGKKTII